MIKKICSGLQTGADLGGILSAKELGIEYFGYMPRGFKDENGFHPEYKVLYNAVETESPEYPPRTAMNVKNSDGTIRIATNFNSGGERLTLKLIQQYKKPHFDINPGFPPSIEEVQKWIKDNNISVLNIAGNRESTSPGIGEFTKNFLIECLKE